LAAGVSISDAQMRRVELLDDADELVAGRERRLGPPR
jgi:hypothetical protein